MSIVSRFRSDERGSIAMIFGLVVIVLALFSGIAVDVSRAYGVSSFVSSALDSTALATARELQLRDMSDTEVQQFAQTRYTALLSNRDGSGVRFEPLNISVNRADETVTITAASVVPTYFAGLAGQDTLDVNESTTVSYNVRVVELAMVLDITGSMNGNKISALKTAATELVEEMIPNYPRTKSNRIALAPYAAAVNLGSLSDRVTEPGNDSADGCVVGRDGLDATAEVAPGSGAWLTAMVAGSPLPDIDPTGGSQVDGYSCPTAQVLPLSKNKGELLNRIQNFAAAGWTAGHLGTAWGWYLVSPAWKSIFDASSEPKPYTDEDTIKAVLLMTDGRFNTRFIGSEGDTSDEQARALCDNMKARNIAVFAVAFEAPSAAEETLRHCATSDDNYFSAESSSELTAAFKEIAGQLTSLRLTH